MGMQHLIKAANAAGFAAVSHDLTPWDDVDDHVIDRPALLSTESPDAPAPRATGTALVIAQPLWTSAPTRPRVSVQISTATQALVRGLAGYVGRVPARA